MDQHGNDVPEIDLDQMADRRVPRAPAGGWPTSPSQQELRDPAGLSPYELDRNLRMRGWTVKTTSFPIEFDVSKIDPEALQQGTKVARIIAFDDHPIEPMKPGRRYLPTFAELVDRMTIVQLKQVFIPQHAKEYAEEIALIEHDLDLLLEERKITGRHVRAIAVLMLTNRCIWESESKARTGEGATLADLTFTHSINGVRNTTKNVLSEDLGERKDYKIDALAADLPEQFGNWRIWE